MDFSFLAFVFGFYLDLGGSGGGGECSAHLLPCSSSRQDVKLGDLS